MTANLYNPNAEIDPDHYCSLPNIKRDMLSFNEAQHIALMDEILPMRANGELLKLAYDIQCPVVAVHGRNDPHPWGGVKEPLECILSNFKMIVIEKCGHEPWKEYYVKMIFLLF